VRVWQRALSTEELRQVRESNAVLTGNAVLRLELSLITPA
jgi:hypothetical protein